MIKKSFSVSVCARTRVSVSVWFRISIVFRVRCTFGVSSRFRARFRVSER